MTPTLSICIPTFNRALCLENLFQNLAKVKAKYGDAVELCVSNNFSTDDTPKVIENWTDRLALKVLVQRENIGATMNVIAVAQVAKSKWILIVGDDDELVVDHLAGLFQLLETADTHDWILVGVSDKSGNEHLLGDLRSGRHSANSFRHTMLRTGLYRFGFIGMHVFPSSLQREFANLSREQAQPWPHLALFLRHLHVGYVQVFPMPIVQQAAGGAVLFWELGDWVEISLRKLNIIAEAHKLTNGLRWFFDTLILRELYSLRNVKTLLLWKAIDPKECSRSIFRVFASRYFLLRSRGVFAAIHFFFVIGVYLVPAKAIRVTMHFLGRGAAIENYHQLKATKGRFDGVNRGL